MLLKKILYIFISTIIITSGAWAATYTVTSTTESGNSLRWAIDQANINPGLDIISFNISSGSVTEGGATFYRIQPQSSLPTISEEVYINGSTQTSNQGNTNPYGPEIEIDGSQAGTGDGLYILNTSYCTIEGLIINNYSQTFDAAILIWGNSHYNRIFGNYIGTDASGEVSKGNYYGIQILSGPTNNIIGGPSAAERNVISGNSSIGVSISEAAVAASITGNNQVIGNYIGTNSLGTAPLGNGSSGISLSKHDYCTIEGNVISNNSYGISLGFSIGAQIKGNYIGTDKNGTLDFGNTYFGISAGSGALLGPQEYTQFNIIGGTTASERNIISGNNGGGIRFSQFSNTSNEVIGNYIGTDVYGTAVIGNGAGFADNAGIFIEEDSSYHIIGGTIEAKKNIISGNNRHGLQIETTTNEIRGNYIGTDASGTADLGNAQIGIYLTGSAHQTKVGGTTEAGRNLISGNNTYGLLIASDSNEVTGNYIGTDINGTADLGNSSYGMYITSCDYNIIGGTDEGKGNLISGNNYGIRIDYSNNNKISANLIGTDITGEAYLGNNLTGIYLSGDSSYNVIGPDNIIATNDAYGILLGDSNNDYNLITQNSIFLNALKGISLASGANNSIAYPVITKSRYENSITTISGTAPASATVEVFSSAGKTYLETVIADASTGTWEVVRGDLVTGEVVTATASFNNNTSEFAQYSDVATLSVTVLTPNGDEFWPATSQQDITWQASGNPEYFAIYYSTGEGWNLIDFALGTMESYPWTVANEPTTEALIRIEAIGSTVTDESDAYFTIGDPNVLTVTTTAETGNGSLRQAITFANNISSDAGAITIDFQIPIAESIDLGGGDRYWSIRITSEALPVISRSKVIIDGTTQAEFIGGDPNPYGPEIEINGSALSNISGISITGSYCTIEGLVINNFTGSSSNIVAINISAGSSNNRIVGNYLGTDATGTSSLEGNTSGIWLGGPNNIIGGSTAAERNIISGNANFGIACWSAGDNSQIIGNYIGTDVYGTASVANQGGIILISAQNVYIGSSTPGEGNIISGNTFYGIGMSGSAFGGDASNNQIKGNYIGTDKNGTTAVGNPGYAMYLGSHTSNNFIGGPAAGEGNVISGNGYGILFFGTNTTEAVATSSNEVAGNYIGTDISGTLDIGNSYSGIFVTGESFDNQIGPNNTIAYNGWAGIHIFGNTSLEVITQNSMYENVGKGISLEAGANNNIAPPTIESVVYDYGTTTITGEAPAGAIIELFITEDNPDPTGQGEGKTFITSTEAHASTGTWEISVSPGTLQLGDIITATSTKYLSPGDTSEFSQNITVEGNPYTVYNTNDSGDGSLRQAIINANNTPGTSPIVINFNIPSSEATTEGGVTWWRISTSASAFYITRQRVHIDGTTQPTAEISNPPGVKVIEVHGEADMNGLSISTPHCTIEGLTINGFYGSSKASIYLNGPSNEVISNYIGTTVTGEAALGNYNGINIYSPYNKIGGTTESERNIISGNTQYGIHISGTNASSNEVIGNYIGTDKNGTARLKNNFGIYLSGAPHNIIGRTTLEGNLISGNDFSGINISGANAFNNKIKGNKIGTNLSGTLGLGNDVGIKIEGGAHDNKIGGAAANERNIISENDNQGIVISTNAYNNRVKGNYIGTKINGLESLPNFIGLFISGNNNIIGGTNTGEGNVISGNSFHGIDINLASSNEIQGNYIGVDKSGTAALGNSQGGVQIANSTYNQIGPENIIAYNGSASSHYGIRVVGSSSLYNLITQNSIYENYGLGIELANGGNNGIPPPVILSATFDEATGTTEVIGTSAGPTAEVEIFSTNGPDPSGSGEGKSYLGSTIADAAGNWIITFEALTSGTTLSATTTHTDNNTSMFSFNKVTGLGIVVISNIFISREAGTNNLIISWTTSPEGEVELYRVTTTDATVNIYTNEASAWTIIATTESTLTIEVNEVGTGFAQAYYKVISTGITDSFATAEAVGKFNKSVPVGLSLFSVPLLLTDSDINVAIGDQLSNNDVIYYFTGTAWQDSTTNGSTWTGGVTDINPDLGYWVRVQTTPSTVTAWGNVSSAASREVSLDSGLNLKGTAYPIRVTLEDSDLGAALSYGSGADTGTLYYFTGSAWQDSSWNGTSWYNKGISYFYPTRGYWIRRNNSAGSTWYYPRLY